MYAFTSQWYYILKFFYILNTLLQRQKVNSQSLGKVFEIPYKYIHFFSQGIITSLNGSYFLMKCACTGIMQGL